MPYNDAFTKMVGDTSATFKTEITALQDNVTEEIGAPELLSGKYHAKGDLNAIIQEIVNNDVLLKAITDKIISDLGSHSGNKNNPHTVTKSQVGLGSVENYPTTSSVSDSSNSKYATAGAVKVTQDNANSRVSKAGDTMTGYLNIETSGWPSLILKNTDSSFQKQVKIENSKENKFRIMKQTHSGTTDTALDWNMSTGGTIYHTGNKPSKADVGLSNVVNYPTTSSVSDASNEKYATAGAVKQAYDRASSGINEANTKVSKAGDTMTGNLVVNTGAAGGEIKLSSTSQAQISLKEVNGKVGIRVGGTGGNENIMHFWGTGDNLFGSWTTSGLSINGNATATKFIGPLQGNADTSTKLATARQINGTNFDGTANITTANWGTARNITIGNTAKSVNGSGNVGWSIAEIGAVNKAGDVLSGGLRTANIGDGFALTFKATDGSPASNRTGIFGGNDAGGTLSKANNIDIKSWFGTSFSDTSSEIPKISFNNRSGDAIFKGTIESTLGRSVGADRSLKFRIGSGTYPSGAVSTNVNFGSAFPIACHGVVCVEQHSDPSWASNHLKVLNKATNGFTLACSSRNGVAYVFIAWGE